MSSNHKKCMVLGRGAGFGVGRNCDGMENKSQVRVAAQQANEKERKKKDIKCTFEEWSEKGTQRAGGAMGEELLRETRLTLE